MPSSSLKLTPLQRQSIVNHVRMTGSPLLRAKTSTDLFAILAWPRSDGGFELSIEDEDEGVQATRTWNDMAGYLGLDFTQLSAVLEERGYEDYLPEDGDAELPDPYAVFDVVKDLQPWVSWDELLADIPHDIVGLTSSGSRVNLGSLEREIGVRPGDETEYVSVTSPEALSALQLLLDQLERRAHIRIASP